MKRTSWKTAFVCGVALSLSSVGLFAHGFADDSKAGGKGRDKPNASKGGGGDKPHAGGEGKQPGNAAGAQKSGGGKGGIHAPSLAAPRQSAPRPPAAGARIDTNPGVTTHGDGQSGAIRHGDQGLRGNVGAGAETHRSGINQSRIANRPFVGNTVNFNNRDFHVGHSSYQPAYYRHSGYHGYWNGNRGYGDASGVVYESRPRVSVRASVH